jgi:hypothetical protein
MYTNDAIAILGGSRRAAAEALGISRQAVGKWGRYVPPLRAYQVREIQAARLAVAAPDPAEHAQ